MSPREAMHHPSTWCHYYGQLFYGAYLDWFARWDDPRNNPFRL